MPPAEGETMEQSKNWLEYFQPQNQVAELLDTNEETAHFGLTLTEKDAQMIVTARQNTLKAQRRVEFGTSATERLIREFCDSQYLEQDCFAETVMRLQDIFFTFRNEMMDLISDDELLHFMREQFDTVCFGDMDYLEGTVLPTFAEQVRGGYDGYKSTDGYGEYAQFDEVKRWDPELYRQVLKDLAWK